jgi:hypothetical protein
MQQEELYQWGEMVGTLNLFVLLYNIVDLLLLDRNVLGQGWNGRSDLLFTA